MAKYVEQGHIDKLITSGNVLPTPHHELDGYEPLQEVLDTSKITKEVTEILTPLETSTDPQFIGVAIGGARGAKASPLF